MKVEWGCRGDRTILQASAKQLAVRGGHRLAVPFITRASGREWLVQFDISFDARARMIRAQAFGYWDETEANAYHRAIEIELRKAASYAPFTVMIDISRLGILPQKVVAIVMGTAATIHASQVSRVALLTNKALSRMQAQRMSPDPEKFRICASEAEALDWLAGEP